ncbi:hypothetical protein PSTT_14070, partial [Puccinia striiformis]
RPGLDIVAFSIQGVNKLESLSLNPKLFHLDLYNLLDMGPCYPKILTRLFYLSCVPSMCLTSLPESFSSHGYNIARNEGQNVISTHEGAPSNDGRIFAPVGPHEANTAPTTLRGSAESRTSLGDPYSDYRSGSNHIASSDKTLPSINTKVAQGDGLVTGGNTLSGEHLVQMNEWLNDDTLWEHGGNLASDRILWSWLNADVAPVPEHRHDEVQRINAVAGNLMGAPFSPDPLWDYPLPSSAHEMHTNFGSPTEDTSTIFPQSIGQHEHLEVSGGLGSNGFASGNNHGIGRQTLAQDTGSLQTSLSRAVSQPRITPGSEGSELPHTPVNIQKIRQDRAFQPERLLSVSPLKLKGKMVQEKGRNPKYLRLKDKFENSILERVGDVSSIKEVDWSAIHQYFLLSIDVDKPKTGLVKSRKIQQKRKRVQFGEGSNSQHYEKNGEHSQSKQYQKPLILGDAGVKLWSWIAATSDPTQADDYKQISEIFSSSISGLENLPFLDHNQVEQLSQVQSKASWSPQSVRKSLVRELICIMWNLNGNFMKSFGNNIKKEDFIQGQMDLNNWLAQKIKVYDWLEKRIRIHDRSTPSHPQNGPLDQDLNVKIPNDLMELLCHSSQSLENKLLFLQGSNFVGISRRRLFLTQEAVKIMGNYYKNTDHLGWRKLFKQDKFFLIYLAKIRWNLENHHEPFSLSMGKVLEIPGVMPWRSRRFRSPQANSQKVLID